MQDHVILQWAGTHFAHLEAAEMVDFCVRMIHDDMQAVPAHQVDWRLKWGRSWHEVRITEYRTAQLLEGIDRMAKPGQNIKKRGKKAAPQYEFARCELSAEDKRAAKAWAEAESKNLGPLLHDVGASGYKIGLSFSDEHDTWTASFSGKPEEAINELMVLTARHKDWVLALMTLLYKHVVIFKSGVWEGDDGEEDDGMA